MKPGGPVIYIVFTILGLYVASALTSGSAWLFPTDRMVSRHASPTVYWTMIFMATVLLLFLIGLWLLRLFA